LGVARLISSARIRLVLHDDRGAGDVGGHQVGRKLDAAVLQVEHAGEGAHQARLAQARHTLEQRVPAGDEAGQHAAHHIVLADDGFTDLAPDLPSQLRKVLRCHGVCGGFCHEVPRF
jgi:hypothetical protein